MKVGYGSAALIPLVFAMVQTETLQDTKDLYKKLLTTYGYNKMIRPIENQSEIVGITTVLYIDAIIDFNEQDGSLTTATYLSMTWIDENLKWNESLYGGISSIYIPQENIWRPDVTLSNSFETILGLGYNMLHVQVYSSGMVHWYPVQLLKSRCNIDITYFPFDTQTCPLTFKAWSYAKEVVRLVVHKDDTVEIGQSFIPNAQWTLVDSSAREDGNHASVTFALRLQRKSTFYVMNIIIPVAMLSVLSIFVFALPVKSGERASFSVTVFLSMAVFLTIVASELPKNSDVTPYIAVYLIIMSGLNTAVSIISVLEIRLAGRDDKENVPEIGSRYRTVHRIVSVLSCSKRGCVSNRKVSNVSESPSMVSIPPSTEDRTTKETIGTEDRITWNDVVDALDILFFTLTIVITFLTTVIFFTIVVFNPQKSTNAYKELEDEQHTAPWYEYYM